MLLKHSTIKILLPKVVEAGQTLAPTSSSLNFLSWGDSLALACIKRKKWTNKKFISTHPSGSLATALVTVKEIMAKGKEIPLVAANKNIKYAIKEMTKKKLGIVCVKEKSGVISIIVDGDLRRNSNNLYRKNVTKIATKNPSWISENTTALSAIDKMTSLKISSLLVAKHKDINKKIKKPAGIITMLQCLSRGVK